MATLVRVRPSPVRFLPVVLILVVMCLGSLLAPIAPVGDTGGAYRIDAGVAEPFSLAVEQFDCERAGDVGRCGVRLGGEQLSIVVTYRVDAMSTCAAEHGSRPVPCETNLDYGPGSHRVIIADQLGVTGAELERVRAGLPWWRTISETGWLLVALVIAALFAATAAALVLRRGVRTPARRTPYLLAVVGLGLTGPPLVGLAILGTLPNLFVVLNPLTLITVVLLTWWQTTLLDETPGRHRVLAAAGSTLLYTAVQLIVFVWGVAGFPD